MERTIASPHAGTGNGENSDNSWRQILTAVLSFLAMVWQRIRAGLWSIRGNLSSEIAKPLNVERICAHLAVVKRAEKEGSRNLPPSDEEVPSGTQREIIAYFTNLRRRAKQQASGTVEKSDKVLEQIQASDSLEALREIPAGSENKILRFFADAESRLSNTAEREQQQKQHYDTFREKNALNRVASYPRAPYLYFLAVPALIAVIAFALSSLIETYSGHTGAVSLTWIIAASAAAVIVPFVLGDTALRSINHVGGFRGFVAWIVVLAGFGLVIGMAYYTDFHIATVLANPETSNRDVVDSILAAPRDVLAEIADWKGFALLVLTGLFAMLLAYRSDDPYPGYGAVQRAYFKARDARDEASSRLRKRINNQIDEAESQIATVAKRFKSRVREYTRLVEKAEQSPSVLNDYDVELEDACNIVLDRYRVANALHRQTESPMSFTEHVCFSPHGETDALQRSGSASQVTELQTAMGELENEGKLARQQLRTLNLRMITSISEPPQSEDTESSV